MSDAKDTRWTVRTDDDTREGITTYAGMHKRPIGYLFCVMYRRMSGLNEVSYEAWRARMKQEGHKE